ncbi:MAG: hypothetical protein LBH98_10600 [Chitinispirillales bacterium]|jgi:hypothetical protein|nr:hypothetical protein [Chitinispirillales bacterium]
MGRSVISPDYMDELLSVHPDSLLFARYAHTLLLSKKLTQAIKIAQDGVERSPDYTSGRFILALCHIELDDISSAMTELTELLKIEPTHQQAISILARLLSDCGDIENSQALADYLIRINPKTQLLGKLQHKNTGKSTIFEILGADLNWEEYASESYSKGASKSNETISEEIVLNLEKEIANSTETSLESSLELEISEAIKQSENFDTDETDQNVETSESFLNVSLDDKISESAEQEQIPEEFIEEESIPEESILEESILNVMPDENIEEKSEIENFIEESGETEIIETDNVVEETETLNVFEEEQQENESQEADVECELVYEAQQEKADEDSTPCQESFELISETVENLENAEEESLEPTKNILQDESNAEQTDLISPKKEKPPEISDYDFSNTFDNSFEIYKQSAPKKHEETDEDAQEESKETAKDEFAKSDVAIEPESESVGQNKYNEEPHDDGEISIKKESDILPDHILTPTFAQIYLEQGLPNFAKQIYERLMLKDVENEAYMEKIKEIDLIIERMKNGEKVSIESKEIRRKNSITTAEKPLKGKRIKNDIRETLKERHSVKNGGRKK